jgi:hypothetical protein
MTQYGAIIADGVPDDLGQSGSGVLADKTLQVAWQVRWRMRDGRMIIEFEQKIDTACVALFRRDVVINRPTNSKPVTSVTGPTGEEPSASPVG